MKPPSLKLALPLLAGLAVGAAGAWTLYRPGPAAPPATAPAFTPLPGGTAGLILAPTLSGAEADAALQAYLALPPLPDKAPAAALQEKRNRLQGLLTLLPASRIERLFASMAVLASDSEAQLRREVFQVWTERAAPVAARAALLLAPDGAITAEERSLFIQQAALAWARDDFAAAYGWAKGFADTGAGRDLAVRLLAQLAETDPTASLALAATGDEALLGRARLAIFQAWSEHDPAAALRTLAPILLEQRSNGWIVRKTLAGWLAREPAAALDWALAQPVVDPQDSLLTYLGSTLFDNPSAIRPLLELLGRQENTPDRKRLFQSLFGSWIQKDYSAATTWLDTITDTARRTEMVERALAYTTKDHPNEYLALTQRLPSSTQREAIISRYFSEWAKTDPDAALALLSRHKEPEFAAAARAIEETLIVTLAATDAPAAVARWEALPTDASRTKAAALLAVNWSRTDPAAAARWLAQQFPDSLPNTPSDYDVNRTLRDVASQWALTDPLGLVDWILTQPNGARDLAKEAFENPNLQWWANNDNGFTPPPRAAYAERLSQIKDPEIRERALLAHLSQWGRADAHALRAWIESSSALTPEAAAGLLNRLDARR